MWKIGIGSNLINTCVTSIQGRDMVNGDTNDVGRWCQIHTFVAFQWKIFVASHHEENYHPSKRQKGNLKKNYHIIDADDE